MGTSCSGGSLINREGEGGEPPLGPYWRPLLKDLYLPPPKGRGEKKSALTEQRIRKAVSAKKRLLA